MIRGVLVAVVLAMQAASSQAIYSMANSSSYHLATCPLAKQYAASPIDVAEAKAKKLTPCIVCRPSPIEPPAKPTAAAPTDASSPYVVWLTTNTEPKYAEFTYVSETPIAARESPDKGAPIVWTLRALEMAKVFDIQPGWVRIASGERRAWVPGPPANLVVRTPEETARLLGTLRDHPAWSVQTKHRIIRQDPAVGFTLEQLTLAMGDPLSATSEESAKGRTDVLVYRLPIGTAMTVELRNGVVTTVRKVD